MHKYMTGLAVVAAATALALPAYGSKYLGAPTERELEAEIRAEFMERDALRGLRIDVDVTAGIARLSGTVPSSDEMELAVEAAREVHGIRSVESTLEPVGDVAESRDTAWSSFGQRIDDMTLQADVRTRLLSSDEIQGVGIDVEVQNGVAVLMGRVENEMERERAERLVEEVRGVREVDNLLIVER